MTKAKEPKPPRPKRAGPATPANPTTGSRIDELWAVLAPLIPQRVNTHPLGGGRPRVPDRTCANGIFYVLRTGCQWKALDATGICSGSTAHLRFQEWVAAGVFRELWRTGLVLDVGILAAMDGALTKWRVPPVGSSCLAQGVLPRRHEATVDSLPVPRPVPCG